MKEIKELEIEVYIQATEDAEKIYTAIKNLIPLELREIGNEVITKKVRGVFHNPITIVRVKYRQNPRQIVEYIAQNLSESDKDYLFQTLQRRIDKGNFYLRFGKQQLYQNKLEIKEIKDIVKVKVGFSNKYATQEKITEILQELDLIAS